MKDHCSTPGGGTLFCENLLQSRGNNAPFSLWAIFPHKFFNIFPFGRFITVVLLSWAPVCKAGTTHLDWFWLSRRQINVGPPNWFVTLSLNSLYAASFSLPTSQTEQQHGSGAVDLVFGPKTGAVREV